MNKLIPRDAPLMGMTPGPSGDLARVKPKPCACPECTNHKKGAKRCCCNGCSADHADSIIAADTDAVLTCTMFGKDGSVTTKVIDTEPKITIADNYLGMAETWFLRHTTDVYRPYAERQMWLVLLNAAYQSTDYGRRTRYEVDKQDKGDYRVVDTNYIPMHWSATKYLQIAHARDKQHAELITKALNAYQPKPQRRR